MGVFHPDLVGIQARVLRQLGSEHVMIVHGSDGLDEITLSGDYPCGRAERWRDSGLHAEPGRFRLVGKRRCLRSVPTMPTPRSQYLLDVLAGKPGPARDIVLLNAGAAIYTAGVAATLAEGVQAAAAAIDSGAARAKLDAHWLQLSHNSRAETICNAPQFFIHTRYPILFHDHRTIHFQGLRYPWRYRRHPDCRRRLPDRPRHR